MDTMENYPSEAPIPLLDPRSLNAALTEQENRLRRQVGLPRSDAPPPSALTDVIIGLVDHDSVGQLAASQKAAWEVLRDCSDEMSKLNIEAEARYPLVENDFIAMTRLVGQLKEDLLDIFQRVRVLKRECEEYEDGFEIECDDDGDDGSMSGDEDSPMFRRPESLVTTMADQMDGTRGKSIQHWSASMQL